MSDVWDVEDAAAASRHVKPPVVVSGARWQGEDEEEDIKDNWEDSDNEADDGGEKETDEKAEAEAAKVKKKRSLKNIISEKEEKKRMEAEERRKAAEEARSNLSPEDAFAEKLRQQKLQEEADLLLAKETFGLLSNETAGTGSRCGIESMQPSSKDDFDTLRKALVETLTKHERSSFYVVFLDELFRDLCVNMEAEDIKKLGNTLQVLGNEKMKAVKALKGKKKGGKGKATLVLGRATDYEATDDYGANEYDDFM